MLQTYHLVICVPVKVILVGLLFIPLSIKNGAHLAKHHQDCELGKRKVMMLIHKCALVCIGFIFCFIFKDLSSGKNGENDETIQNKTKILFGVHITQHHYK